MSVNRCKPIKPIKMLHHSSFFPSDKFASYKNLFRNKKECNIQDNTKYDVIECAGIADK